MTAYWYTAIHQKSDRLSHDRTAFNLDHMRLAFTHESRRTIESTLGTSLKRAKRHVRNKQSILTPARNTSRVIHRIVQGHRQGGRMALNNHTEAVSHQQDLDPRPIKHMRKTIVIDREAANTLAPGLHRRQPGNCDW